MRRAAKYPCAGWQERPPTWQRLLRSGGPGLCGDGGRGRLGRHGSPYGRESRGCAYGECCAVDMCASQRSPCTKFSRKNSPLCRSNERKLGIKSRHRLSSMASEGAQPSDAVTVRATAGVAAQNRPNSRFLGANQPKLQILRRTLMDRGIVRWWSAQSGLPMFRHPAQRLAQDLARAKTPAAQ